MEKRKFTEWLNYKPTKIDLKIKYFEHFVSRLVKQTANLDEFRKNDYSQVKVMKLLFFTCCTDTELLKVFDNWHALPYGHVEKDIHTYMKQNDGKFSFFRVTRFGIELGYEFDDKSKP